MLFGSSLRVTQQQFQMSSASGKRACHCGANESLCHRLPFLRIFFSKNFSRNLTELRRARTAAGIPALSWKETLACNSPRELIALFTRCFGHWLGGTRESAFVLFRRNINVRQPVQLDFYLNQLGLCFDLPNEQFSRFPRQPLEYALNCARLAASTPPATANS
jgi:hypothetical protein